MLAFFHLIYGAVITWLLLRRQIFTKLVNTIEGPSRLTLPPTPPLTGSEIPPDFCVNTNDPPSILEECFSPLRKITTVLNKTRTVTEAQKVTRPDCANRMLPGFVVVSLLALVFLLLAIYPFIHASKKQRTSQLRNSRINAYIAQLQQQQDEQAELLANREQRHHAQHQAQDAQHKAELACYKHSAKVMRAKIEVLQKRSNYYRGEVRTRATESRNNMSHLIADFAAERKKSKSEIEECKLSGKGLEDQLEKLRSETKSEVQSYKNSEDKLKEQVKQLERRTVTQEAEFKSEVEACKHHVDQLKAEAERLQTLVSIREKEIESRSRVRYHTLETWKTRMNDLQAQASAQQEESKSKIKGYECHINELKTEMAKLQTQATTRENHIESSADDYQHSMSELTAQMEDLRTQATKKEEENKSKEEDYEHRLRALQKQLRESQNQNRIWQLRVNNQKSQSSDVVAKTELEQEKIKSFSALAAAATAADKQQNRSDRRIRELTTQLKELRKTYEDEVEQRDDKIRQLEEANESMSETAQAANATQDRANQQIAQQGDQIKHLQAVCDQLNEQAANLQADCKRLFETTQAAPQPSPSLRSDIVDIDSQSPPPAQQSVPDDNANKDDFTCIDCFVNTEKLVVPCHKSHDTVHEYSNTDKDIKLEQDQNGRDLKNEENNYVQGTTDMQSDNVNVHKDSNADGGITESVNAVSSNEDSLVAEPEQKQTPPDANDSHAEAKSQIQTIDSETCTAGDGNQKYDAAIAVPSTVDQPTISTSGENTQLDPTAASFSPSNEHTQTPSVIENNNSLTPKVQRIQHLPEKQESHDELGVRLPQLTTDVSEIPAAQWSDRSTESRLIQHNRTQLSRYNVRRRKAEEEKHLTTRTKLHFRAQGESSSGVKNEHLVFVQRTKGGEEDEKKTFTYEDFLKQ